MAFDYQKAFDTVVNGLIDQGEYAIDFETHSCVIRDSGGCKCAIGMLVPDAMFPYYDNESILKVIDSPLFRTFWNITEEELSSEKFDLFCRTITRLHDGMIFFDPYAIELESAMKCLSALERYNIDTTALVGFWERQRDQAEKEENKCLT